MTKILVGDEWYETVDPGAYYESEFERVLVQKSGVIFPAFHALPFKKVVSSETDSARADYALIEKGYREWWVVEVEMSYHSLSGHVIPQIRTLANARYGHEEAEYLARQKPDLHPQRLMDMMKGTPPTVLVVLDRPEPSWVLEVERENAKMAVFEILRSKRHRYIYRVNGFVPSSVAEIVSCCRLDPLMPMLLCVESPGGLGVERGEEVDIAYDGRLTVWSRLDTAGQVWLKPETRNPLREGERYQLQRTCDGRLFLEICAP